MKTYFKSHIFKYRYYLSVFCCSLFSCIPVYAAEPSEPLTDTFTDIVTGMLTWFLSSMSSVTAWILGNPMAATYASIFLVGCVIAVLFRILHSV